MFERSEFPRRFDPREAQGTAVAAGRSGTRTGEKQLWFLWVHPKEPARAAGGSSYLPLKEQRARCVKVHSDPCFAG